MSLKELRFIAILEMNFDPCMVINQGKCGSVFLNFPQFYAARTQEIVMQKLGQIFHKTIQKKRKNR